MLTLKRVLSSPSRWFSADQASSQGRPSLYGLLSPLSEIPFSMPWMGVRALSRDSWTQRLVVSPDAWGSHRNLSLKWTQEDRQGMSHGRTVWVEAEREVSTRSAPLRLRTLSQKCRGVMEGLCWFLSHKEGFGVAHISSLCNSNGSQWDSEDSKSACCISVCHQKGRKGGLFEGRWLWGRVVGMNTKHDDTYVWKHITKHYCLCSRRKKRASVIGFNFLSWWLINLRTINVIKCSVIQLIVYNDVRSTLRNYWDIYFRSLFCVCIIVSFLIGFYAEFIYIHMV